RSCAVACDSWPAAGCRRVESRGPRRAARTFRGRASERIYREPGGGHRAPPETRTASPTLSPRSDTFGPARKVDAPLLRHAPGCVDGLRVDGPSADAAL